MNTIKKQTNPASLTSPVRISRLKEQGYCIGFTDQEISKHAMGNRFSYQMCTLLFSTGLALTSIPILTVAAIIAFLIVILPCHPFDYDYNCVIRHIDIEKLYHSLPGNSISINSNGRLQTIACGQKEFALLAPDNNLLTFGQSI